MFYKTLRCSSARPLVIDGDLMFSTSYFKSSLSTISIKRVNAMPLWDFLPSSFEVVLKIMTIAELFILMTTSPGPVGYFHIRRSGGGGGLTPKFASEILVGAPNFASKNISDKYPKFCPLDFRYDPKIGTFPNFCVLW